MVTRVRVCSVVGLRTRRLGWLKAAGISLSCLQVRFPKCRKREPVFTAQRKPFHVFGSSGLNL